MTKKTKGWLEELADQPSEEAPHKDLSKAHAALRKRAEARAKSVAERVQEILANERVDRDLKDKLRYCQREIDKGRDNGLVERRKQLIKEARRRFGFPLDNPK